MVRPYFATDFNFLSKEFLYFSQTQISFLYAKVIKYVFTQQLKKRSTFASAHGITNYGEIWFFAKSHFRLDNATVQDTNKLKGGGKCRVF